MCVMLPMTVEAVEDGSAWVRAGRKRLLVNRMPIADLRVGEMVLVSGGVCVERIDSERAAAIKAALIQPGEGEVP